MKIPSSSISRISLYYRALLSLKDTSVISSQELADLTECNAAQVRKDLTYFGQFGRPGKGYDTETLKLELKKILGIDRDWDVVLVGVGNLGSALLAYKGFKSQGFNIKYAFDNNIKKIGKTKQGIKIRSTRELKSIIRSRHIDMAILAVSQESAQTVVDNLVTSGIKAILNFAPVTLKVPSGVELLNIDLSMELERLTYFLRSNI
ncbi:MAG: redox-sensing transcriptional repressor Rex [Candidatus Omnitrophica bacterium]|nr:redox-sensing transcriptional repressor Rex [Candidatus Omnitrophota bacterium]